MTELDRLLQPMSVERFISEYFEKAPLHVVKEGDCPLLDPSDVDALIAATAETNPRRLRANLRGRVFVPPRNASAARLYRWARELYDDGATVVINYIDSVDLRCRSFAAKLGTALDARVTLTVFMTPSDAQGFAPHFDTLDVFVLQVGGSKNWRLGEAVLRLPTLRQGYLVDFKGEQPRVEQRICMAPGNVLYIPRGVVHWACTSGEPSVHITADISTATVGDVLSAAVKHPSFLDAPERIESARCQRLVHASDPLSLDLHELAVSLQSTNRLSSLCDKARIAKWARKE